MCILNDSEHACFENSFKQDCAACLEDLFGSTTGCSMLQCGHAMHAKCLKNLVESDYRCPTCKKSVVDMSETWKVMAEDLERQMEQVKDQV